MNSCGLHDVPEGTVFNFADVPNTQLVMYKKKYILDSEGKVSSVIIQYLPFVYVESLCTRGTGEKLDSVDMQDFVCIKEVTSFEMSCGRVPQVCCNPYYTAYVFNVLPCLCVSRKVPY